MSNNIMKSFLKKIRKFSSLQKKNLQKLFTKLENKEMKNGCGAHDIDANRLIKIGGGTHKKLNTKGSPFQTVNSSLNSLRNLNETQLKKVHRRIHGGGKASYTIIACRKVDEPREHAINEMDHKGVRLATVVTLNGVDVKKTTQAFRNAIGRIIKINSKSFNGEICGVSMRNQNVVNEMNHPSFGHSDCIKMIYNGSHDPNTASNHDVSQIVVLNDDANQAMNCKHLKHEINNEAKTFGELFHQPRKCDRQNSCMFNAIMNYYENSFEKSNHKNLTYNMLCGIVGKKEKKRDNAVSVSEIKKFFEKCKLGLTVYDSMYSLVDKFTPYYVCCDELRRW